MTKASLRPLQRFLSFASFLAGLTWVVMALAGASVDSQVIALGVAVTILGTLRLLDVLGRGAPRFRRVKFLLEDTNRDVQTSTVTSTDGGMGAYGTGANMRDLLHGQNHMNEGDYDVTFYYTDVRAVAVNVKMEGRSPVDFSEVELRLPDPPAIPDLARVEELKLRATGNGTEQNPYRIYACLGWALNQDDPLQFTVEIDKLVPP